MFSIFKTKTLIFQKPKQWFSSAPSTSSLFSQRRDLGPRPVQFRSSQVLDSLEWMVRRGCGLSCTRQGFLLGFLWNTILGLEWEFWSTNWCRISHPQYQPEKLHPTVSNSKASTKSQRCSHSKLTQDQPCGSQLNYNHGYSMLLL